MNGIHLPGFYLPKLPLPLKETNLVEHGRQIPTVGNISPATIMKPSATTVSAAPPPHSECDHMFSSASPEKAISPSRGFMDREWTRRQAAGVVYWIMPSQTAQQYGTYQTDSSHKDTFHPSMASAQLYALIACWIEGDGALH
ncbi:hypothetical protein CIB48_g10282 [Xylaria polymorpha]|nr:hypothetical protein CIB48_g10282 [Xylaria polymorpha]